MATDPSALIQQLVNAGGNIGQQFLLGQQQGQEAVLNNQRAQQGAIQLATARQQAARDAQLQADLADYSAAPVDQKAAKLTALMAKYPEHAAAYKGAYDLMSAPQRDSHALHLYELYNSAKSGDGKLVAAKIAQIAQAEGNNDSDLKTLQSELASNNPEALNDVLTYAHGHFAFAAPDKAKELGMIQDPFTLSEGQTRFDAGGKPIAAIDAKAPPPHYEKIDVFDKYGTKTGERIVQVGGGQAAAAGASSASAGTGGAASGGADQPLSARLNNPGAIRFDPNNQWQGQVGQQGGFVQFDTAANGARAHQKLIANQIKAGYDTPLAWAQHYAPASDGNDPAAYAKTIANGLGIGVGDKIPLSAVPKVAKLSAQVEAGGTPAPKAAALASGAGAGGGRVLYDSTAGQGGAAFDPTTQIRAGDETSVPADIRSTVKAIATGQMAQPSSFALTKPYWQNIMSAVSAYDPTFDSSTQPQRVAAAKAFTGNGKAAQTLASIDRLAYHMNDLYRDSQALTGVDLGPFSGMVNAGAQSFQKAALARYNATLPFIAGELQKLTKNGSATVDESKHIMDNLAPSQPASARLAAIQQLVELAQGQFKPIRDQWQSAFNDRPMPKDISREANTIFDRVIADQGPAHVDGKTGRIVSTGAGTAASAPSGAAVQYLRANPGLARQFDEKYGLGSAARILGR